jgi:hypothetical protein
VAAKPPKGQPPDTESIEALAESISSQPDSETVAQQLVHLAEGMELFHIEDQETYASVIADGHRETWPVKSKGTREYLTRLFYNQTGRVPGSQALQDALGVLHGRALYDGPERKVYVRIAHLDNIIYLDLCDAQRRIVQVTADGWCFASDPPVRFRRPRGMLPLPVPVYGGSLEELRPFINVMDVPAWRLVIVFLICAFFPGPYCILNLQGRQGSAKTNASRCLRQSVDPNRSPVRAQPRSVRDLLIAASNSLFVVLDNVSFIEDWLSDALCRLSTGGGFSTRELFSDTDEVILDAQRPAILNGIATDVVARGDLHDRCITLELRAIKGKGRKTEAILKKEFELAWPRILGATLDAASGVLRHAPQVHIDELPRMADFALRGAALERALGWPEGSFMAAYEESIASANDVVLSVSLIAPFVRKIAETGFQGTAADLLERLNAMLDGQWPPRDWNGPYPRPKPRQKGWPANPAILSGQLRRLAPNLEAAGIIVTFDQTSGSGSKKSIVISRATADPPQAQAALQPAGASPAPMPAPVSPAQAPVAGPSGGLVQQILPVPFSSGIPQDGAFSAAPPPLPQPAPHSSQPLAPSPVPQVAPPVPYKPFDPSAQSHGALQAPALPGEMSVVAPAPYQPFPQFYPAAPPKPGSNK